MQLSSKFIHLHIAMMTSLMHITTQLTCNYLQWHVHFSLCLAIKAHMLFVFSVNPLQNQHAQVMISFLEKVGEQLFYNQQQCKHTNSAFTHTYLYPNMWLVSVVLILLIQISGYKVVRACAFINTLHIILEMCPSRDCKQT